jgi:predicted RNA-binding protein with RPS1 domain
VFVEKFPVGSTVEGEVKNKTEFGLFLGLEGDVDGMVHLSDLDWKLPGEQVIDNFKKGDMVKAVVLDVDVEKERISLGVKQLEGDPFAEPGDVKKGAVVTCEVLEVKEAASRSRSPAPTSPPSSSGPNWRRDRNDQRAERFRRRRKGRCAGDPVRQEGPQGAGLDQGAGKSPKRRKPSRNTAPPIRGATLGDIWHRAQAAHRQVSLRLLVCIHQGPGFRPSAFFLFPYLSLVERGGLERSERDGWGGQQALPAE